MGSKVEYVESGQLRATSYVRNSKAIGVLWAIFSICYAVLAAVAFLTPEWIGEPEGEYPGRLGLWQACRTHAGAEENCVGRLDELGSLPGGVLRLAAALVALALAAALFTICAMLLFFFCRSTTVFHICGWLQLLSAVCMVAGVALYPAGWSESVVQETCGPAADQYHLGNCNVRWAYLLAVIACLDAIILSTLAFILATRHIRLHPDSPYNNGSLYKGEVNNAYVTDVASMSGSRKSLALQPVLIMHPHAPQQPLDLDGYPHYAHRAKHLHNYQL